MPVPFFYLACMTVLIFPWLPIIPLFLLRSGTSDEEKRPSKKPKVQNQPQPAVTPTSPASTPVHRSGISTSKHPIETN